MVLFLQVALLLRRSTSLRRRAAALVESGHWRAAVAELREAVEILIGMRRGERAFLDLLALLRSRGYATEGLHAEFLAFDAWARSVLFPLPLVVDLFVSIFRSKAALREQAIEREAEVSAGFGLLWASLPDLRIPPDEDFFARPALHPDQLQPLLEAPELDDGESVGDARRRLIRGLPERFRPGGDVGGLVGTAHRLRNDGVLSQGEADLLVDTLVDMPDIRRLPGRPPWHELRGRSPSRLPRAEVDAAERRIWTGPDEPAGPLPDRRVATPIAVTMTGLWSVAWVTLGGLMILIGLTVLVSAMGDPSLEPAASAVPLIYGALLVAAGLGGRLAVRRRQMSVRTWSVLQAMLGLPICVGLVQLVTLVSYSGVDLTEWALEELQV